VAHELEVRIGEQIMNIVTRSCVEIVDTEDFATLAEESLAKMRANETCTTCDHNVGFV
jgi:hypothetical protein